MQQRQNLRSENPRHSGDKSANKLIALPGCPGIGKSTFMAHFPESEAYKSYVKLRSSSSPIVAPFSFNSMMNSGEPMLGLRILFGAAECMVTEETKKVRAGNWIEFYTSFSDFDNLSAEQSLSILRQVYGEDRLVIILADEISKAHLNFVDEQSNITAGKMIMTQLGIVLDSNGDNDVLVSSLSPQYIETLLSNSNRAIDYCVLLPILDVNLASDRCKIWRDKILRTYRVGKPDPFVSRILEAMPLLASGHPRSIEWIYITSYLEDDAYWGNTISAIKVPVPRASIVIQSLLSDLDNISTFSCYNKLKNVKVCFETALSWKSTLLVTDAVARSLVEDDFLHVIQDTINDSPTSFRFAMRLGHFIKHIHTVDRSAPVVQAAYDLFGDVFANGGGNYNISDWWERSVCLTIVSRSISGNTNIFGSGLETISLAYPSLIVKVARTSECLKSIADGELIIAPQNFQGFDSLVRIMQKFTYLQMKISKTKKSRTITYFEAIRSSLQTHLWLYPNIPLSDVSIIFYEWTYIDDVKKITMIRDIGERFKEWLEMKAFEDTKKVLRVNDAILNEVELEKIANEFNSQIKDYVDKFLVINIHFVDRAILNTWLLPTLAPIPRIVQAIDVE